MSMGKSSGTDQTHRGKYTGLYWLPSQISLSWSLSRLEEFLVPELQATEEEKSKLESGLTNGDEPMDQDLSVLPTKCISSIENLEIRSVIFEIFLQVNCPVHSAIVCCWDCLKAKCQRTKRTRLSCTNHCSYQDIKSDLELCIKKTFILSSCFYRARITYIDYEGRSDGDSIKKIINQMKPRQLVIVHGPPEASLDLAESCKAFSKDIKVYTPKLQETIDATSETHIYQVSVSQGRLRLLFVPIGCI